MGIWLVARATRLFSGDATDKEKFRFWRIRYPLDNDDTFFVITSREEDERDAFKTWKEAVFPGGPPEGLRRIDRLGRGNVLVDEVAVDLSPAAEEL